MIELSLLYYHSWIVTPDLFSWLVTINLSLLKSHSRLVPFDFSLLTCQFQLVTLNLTPTTCHSPLVTIILDHTVPMYLIYVAILGDFKFQTFLLINDFWNLEWSLMIINGHKCRYLTIPSHNCHNLLYLVNFCRVKRNFEISNFFVSDSLTDSYVT